MKKEFALSASERRALERSAPEMVKRFADDSENLGVVVSAFRKVAQAAKAQREALQEVALLELVQQGVTNQEGLRERLAGLAATNEALDRENKSLRESMTALKASPALAVHSDE